jgi:tRNA G46 methylase TrmB
MEKYGRPKEVTLLEVGFGEGDRFVAKYAELFCNKSI